MGHYLFACVERETQDLVYEVWNFRGRIYRKFPTGRIEKANSQEMKRLQSGQNSVSKGNSTAAATLCAGCRCGKYQGPERERRVII